MRLSMLRASKRQNAITRMMQNRHDKWSEDIKHFEKGLFYVHDKHIRYAPRSLFVFDYSNRFRIIIVWIIEWRVFEWFIIVSIIMNSVALAVYDYTDRNSLTSYNQIIDKVQLSLTIVFTLEALLRILGMGFIIHQNSYLRDPWNWLDLFSMIIGWFELLPNIPNLKFLRTLRVIRPLRSIKAIPSMRRLIKSLLQSLPLLGHVVVFLFFFFLLFGILGVYIFKGEQYSRCRLTPQPFDNGTWPIDYSQTRLCATNYAYQCEIGTYCGKPNDYNLDINQLEFQKDSQIAYGLTSFDNLLYALLTIFQVITLEGWVKIMYQLYDTDADYMSPIYFIIIVIFGAFFLLNLILAVIMESFAKVDKTLKLQELKDQLKRLELRTGKTVMSPTNLKAKGTKAFKQQGFGDRTAKSFKDQTKKIDSFCSEEDSIHTEENFSSSDEEEAKDEIMEIMAPQNDLIGRMKEIQEKSRDLEQSLDQSQDAPEEPLPEKDHMTQSKRNSQSMKSSFHQPMTFLDKIKKLQTTKVNGIDYDASMRYKEDIDERIYLNKVYKLAYSISNNKIFTGTIFVLILINTVVLCMDRYPMSDEEFAIFDIINTVFFGCFFIEMLLKLIALGPKLYIRDKFNIFDCCIIILSIAETSLKYSAQQTAIRKAFTAFRAIRLLRIFKLARQWRSFQVMLFRIANTFKDVSNFSVLLFIFLYIYALLGMELYAERVKFDEDNNPTTCDEYGFCPGTSLRLNFDTWPNAMIAVFIILVGDDWNAYMFDYVRSTSQITILYFTSLTVIGNLILLNLFLAILLKQFEQDHTNDDQPSDLIILWVKIKQWLESKKVCERCRKRVKKYEIDVENIQQQDVPPVLPLHNQLESLQFEQSEESFDNTQKEGALNIVYEKAKITPQKIDEDIPQSKDQDESLNSESNRQFIIKVNEVQNDSALMNDSMTNLQFMQPKTTVEQHEHVNRRLSKFERKTTNKNNEKDISFDEIPVRRQTMKNSQLDAHEGTPKISLNGNHIYQQMYMGINSKIENLQYIEQPSQDQNSNVRNLNLFHKTLSNQALNKLIDLEGKSLYLFQSENKFRIWIAKLVSFKIFDTFIILLIIASTITLALDLPLSDPNSKYNSALYYCDLTFSIVFGIESLLKMIAFGLAMNGKKSYLRSSWNIMDFVIVLVSFFSLVSDNQLKFMKSLRMLRILRPLRMISKNEGLKVAVLCLIHSIKDIFNVFVISFFAFSLYGIFGVNFFKGQFYECYTDQIFAKFKPDMTMVITKWDCINVGGEWFTKPNNFDHLFRAVLTLFQMATTEGWTDILYSGVDATSDYDHLPKQDSNLSASIYFIGFILLGSLFVTNLFVGVVINTFKHQKEKIGQNFLLTETQKEWVKVQLKCYLSKPIKKDVESKNIFRRSISRMTKSIIFEWIIYTCIILNTVVLACNWYMMPKSLEEAFDDVNHAFTVIFTIEALMKLIALGKDYFKQTWNIFDFAILIGTYIQTISMTFFDRALGAHATILRVFRIGRVLSLVKKAKSLQSIFNTLIVTLPSLANIGLLLFLLLIFYSILGVNLFGKVKIHGSLNHYANFQNFLNAFLTLLRCATGESWNELMTAFMDTESVVFDCISDPSYADILANNGLANGCGSYWTSLLFFISFEILVTFIFLNLFIAIILEGFSDTTEDQNLRVDDIMIKKFIGIWKEFDPEGSGFIGVSDFTKFLTELIYHDSDLINGGEYLLKDTKELNKFIAELQLPLYNSFSQFNFQDVLTHLSKTIFKIDFERFMLIKKAQESQSQQTTVFDDSDSMSYLNAQDQLQFNSFEELMFNFTVLVKENKIQLYEELRKIKNIEERRKAKIKDKYQGHFYDSRVIIYIPKLIQKLKNFTLLMKERRKIQTNQQMRESAQREIEFLKINKSPQIILDRQQRRESIFVMMARSTQDKPRNSLSSQNTQMSGAQKTSILLKEMTTLRVQDTLQVNNFSQSFKLKLSPTSNKDNEWPSNDTKSPKVNGYKQGDTTNGAGSAKNNDFSSILNVAQYTKTYTEPLIHESSMKPKHSHKKRSSQPFAIEESNSQSSVSSVSDDNEIMAAAAKGMKIIEDIIEEEQSSSETKSVAKSRIYDEEQHGEKLQIKQGTKIIISKSRDDLSQENIDINSYLNQEDLFNLNENNALQSKNQLFSEAQQSFSNKLNNPHYQSNTLIMEKQFSGSSSQMNNKIDLSLNGPKGKQYSKQDINYYKIDGLTPTMHMKQPSFKLSQFSFGQAQLSNKLSSFNENNSNSTIQQFSIGGNQKTLSKSSTRYMNFETIGKNVQKTNSKFNNNQRKQTCQLLNIDLQSSQSCNSSQIFDEYGMQGSMDNLMNKGLEFQFKPIDEKLEIPQEMLSPIQTSQSSDYHIHNHQLKTVDSSKRVNKMLEHELINSPIQTESDIEVIKRELADHGKQHNERFWQKMAASEENLDLDTFT